MIDIDWTLGALIINFLVLVFLLNVVLFRPIRKALKERQARLDAQAADINLMETQGLGLDSEIKDKLAAARREGAGAREVLKEEGAAAETSLLAEVKREAEISRIATSVARRRAPLLPYARQALTRLSASCRLVLLTKGEYELQRRRVVASGLEGLFEKVMIVDHKDAATFRQLAAELKVRIPAKVNADSEGNANGIPGRRRTVLGA